MQDFAHVVLKLKKAVQKGDMESLLSLFDPIQRFEPMTILTDAGEDTTVNVMVGQLGEIDLKLGADMKTDKKKTIMTLFWYSERSKTFEIKRAAERGETINVKMTLK